jgi:hypothetical protein
MHLSDGGEEAVGHWNRWCGVPDFSSVTTPPLLWRGCVESGIDAKLPNEAVP